MRGESLKLPAIRAELKVLETMPSRNGEKNFLIHDPVKNAYFTINERTALIFRHWSNDAVENVLTQINRYLDKPVSNQELNELVQFLYANHLTLSAHDNGYEAYLQQEELSSPPWYQQIIHKYLFFRIPLFYPDRFLSATYFLVKPFFKKSSWVVIAVFAILGLFFLSRQWETFLETFLHFLSFEGAIFYALSLFLIMGLHELGHAYAAHHYRCRVTTIGVAFLVMFPVMYTDITDAWRLTDKKQRLVIDLGGIAVELIIAVIATLLWNFLPDGIWRSIAFFSATTSWVLSFAVNLNPFMRFDGYYVFSDFIGVSNLQDRSFALGRWKLREWLFGLGHEVPERFTRWQTSGLVAYAWGTWIYRFFLFLGIALFVHAFFAKALGIILFIIEISWFILKPISREIKMWIMFRSEIVQSKRGKGMMLAALCMVVLFCTPLSTTIKVPAILKADQQTQIYPPMAGIISHIHVEEGDFVQAGDLLMVLDLPDIREDYNQTLVSISLLEARLSRLNADVIDRSNLMILKQSLSSERERATGLEKQLADANITAPHKGIISNLYKDIHVDQWVNQELFLADIINFDKAELIAMPQEQQVTRIAVDNHVKFIADDLTINKRLGKIVSIGGTSKKSVETPAFSSLYGGPIAVREDKFGKHIPDTAIVEVRADMSAVRPSDLKMTVLGVAHIKAKPESFLKMSWRRIISVFIREADF